MNRVSLKTPSELDLGPAVSVEFLREDGTLKGVRLRTSTDTYLLTQESYSRFCAFREQDYETASRFSVSGSLPLLGEFVRLFDTESERREFLTEVSGRFKEDEVRALKQQTLNVRVYPSGTVVPDGPAAEPEAAEYIPF